MENFIYCAVKIRPFSQLVSQPADDLGQSQFTITSLIYR